jgi:hypothetical protein
LILLIFLLTSFIIFIEIFIFFFYFSQIQLTTLAMCLSLSATVILFCLFFPKLRVVLFKPNKNVRTKSSNIVKSVYTMNHQTSIQRTVEAVACTTTSMPTDVEKSLTIATGVSSGSTPSSPGIGRYFCFLFVLCVILYFYFFLFVF